MTFRTASPGLLTVSGPASPASVLAVSGFVCDRYTTGGMEGSRLLARAAAQRVGAPVREVAEAPHAVDLGWRESLDLAMPFLRRAADAVQATMAAGFRPLVFANRCGASIATIAAALRERPDAVVVWCDAHGDFNTPESTPTGYLGGMVLTALCGLWDSGLGAGLSPDRIVLVGARDLDDAEKALLDRHGVRTIVTTGERVDPRLVADAVGGRPTWLHVDTDIVDPAHLPAEYRVPGGLHPAGLRAVLEAVAGSAPLVGFEMTEFEAPGAADERQRAVDGIMDAIEPVLAGFAPRPARAA
jgi:arginase